jgi:hypothetical protein
MFRAGDRDLAEKPLGAWRMTRREQLEGLLERSRDGSVMEQRARLVRQCEERLVRAYVPAGLGAAAQGELRTQVVAAVAAAMRKCGRARISEGALRELEDAVRVLAASALAAEESKRAATVKRGGGAVVCTGGDQSVPPARVGATTGAGPGASSSLPSDDYQVLMEAERVAHLLDEQARRSEDAARKRETKALLDAQVAALTAARERESKEEEALGEQIFRDARAYQEEQKRSAAEMLARNQAEKEERDLTLKEQAARKHRAELRQKREEEQELLDIAASLEAERLAKLASVRSQAAFMKQVQEDNVRQKAIREQQKRALWEEDARMNAAYGAKLDRETRQREANLKALQDNSSRNQQMFLAATAAGDAAMAQVERKANDYLEQKHREDEAKHAAKEQARKDALKAIHVSLSEQIARKKERAEEERRAFDEASRAAAREAERAAAAEREEKAEAKRRADRYREELDQQVRHKEQLDTEPLKMQGPEVLLNSQKVKAVQSDKMLAELVKRNLTTRPAQLLQQRKAELKAKARVKSSYYD